MEISRIDTFLTVAGSSIDRNFTFMLSAPLNCAGRTANVRIKRDYFLANGMNIKPKDKVYISIAVNSGAKVLLFVGDAVSISVSSAYAELRAVQSGIKTGSTFETYRGISYKQALDKLCPKLDYQASSITPEQIVLKGRHTEAFDALLQSLKSALKAPVYHWMKASGEVKIADSIGGGASYDVSGALISAGAEHWEIFPIPELEIGDSLSLNGGQTVTVRGIVLDTTARAVMRCSII